MNVDLPLPTRIVIGASKFVGSFGIFIGIGLGILLVRASDRITGLRRGVTLSTESC